LAVRLFVGNLPYGVTEPELRQFFAAVAPPSHISIPIDRETGRPRGFAFVEFPDRPVAEEVIQRFNGQQLNGRTLSISEARAREDRGPGGFAPRPPGAFGPRPMRTPDEAFAPGGPPGERPSRTFGPPAPSRKQKATAKGRLKTEQRPKGPIREKTTGRVFDVDDDPSADEVIEVEDFATSLPADEENE
jgi:RNA recognition motif-containing protein